MVGAAIKLHPDFGPRVREAEGCAPLIVAGPKLTAIRRQLRFQHPARRTAGRTGTDLTAAGRIYAQWPSIHAQPPVVC